jgi:hypothetical protein
MSRCGAANQIQQYPRQPAKHLDLQATERKANQLADLRIDDTHTALSLTGAGRWRWRWDLIAREEFGLPSFAYSVPERPVNPCMTPQVSKVSGLASLLRGRGAKSPDSIILIRPLLLRPLKRIQ